MSKFDKIIGYEDIKAELKRYANVLMEHEKYAKLGVMMPSGILLHGDPGLGKTLMAKCFIEETGCRTFTLRKEKPDGDFVNQIRETFEAAKKETDRINMDSYDFEVEERFGIMAGEKRIVYIKTGRGETIYGYNNKYVDIAQKIKSQYGYAVVVSSNPLEEECDLEAEIGTVLEQNSNLTDIIFIGYSNGAVIGAQQGYKIPFIKNMLLINGPLMINWHRIREGIEKYAGSSVLFVYGTKDPSAKWTEMITYLNSKVCKLEMIDGVDHNFVGRIEDFKRTIIDYVAMQ